MIRSRGDTLVSETDLAVSYSYDLDMSEIDGCAFQVTYADATPADAKTFDSGVYEVQTLTYDTKANTTHQDFVIVSDAAGLTYALALTKPVAAVDTLDVADVASTGPGDYAAFYDAAGLRWAFSLDTTGSDPEPTGAIWTSIAAGRKVHVDISGVANDEDVTPLIETALNALTGFSAAFTTDDTAADGTMLITRDVKGLTSASVVKNADDSGAGSISLTTTTAGVTSEAPSGPLWTAVHASRKGIADISGDTTAAQVAARAETAWNLLTGFTAAITTDDTAANGTMTLTQTAFGPTTNPVPKNAAEDGAGSIAGVQSTAGVTSEIDLDDNEFSIPSHGFVTGLKVAATTSAADFPAGLSATNYYVIVVDANTIKLATSAALAALGTAVNVTDEGTGVHTLTPASLGGVVVKLQASNDAANFDDIANMTVTISADGTKVWNIVDPFYRYIRLLHTPSAGAIDLTVKLNAKTREP